MNARDRLMTDKQTLDVYALRASDYAQRFHENGPGKHLREFLDAMPSKARILDLGCGPGRAASLMIAEGYNVDAWDASPEMAGVGRDLYDVDIETKPFDALDAEAFYDGVYANFSLLHAPKSELPGLLHRIAMALKPGGLFHIGLKSGEGEARDALGRFYAYYMEVEIAEHLENAGFLIETQAKGEDPGLDGTIAPWIILKARKDD